jgi:hypothetical protein
MRSVEEQFRAASNAVELASTIDLESRFRVPASSTANRASRVRGLERHKMSSPDLDLPSTIVLIDPLNNWRKHKQSRRYECANWQVDYFSTAPSFTGWARSPDADCSHDFGWSYEPMPATEPTHFFLERGWRLVGRIRYDAVPSA